MVLFNGSAFLPKVGLGFYLMELLAPSVLGTTNHEGACQGIDAMACFGGSERDRGDAPGEPCNIYLQESAALHSTPPPPQPRLACT